VSALRKPFHFSEADYLAFEATTDLKHEYVDGYIHAMAGASERHNRITMNIGFHLRSGARGGHCGVFLSNMKFRAEHGHFYYFPDVMLVCNQNDDNQLYKEKPFFIAEVASVSTEKIDRREKWVTYSKVETLRYYLLVDSTKKFVEYYFRDEQNQWQAVILEDGEMLEIECENYRTVLDVESIYEDVTFS
jgi:Uma2 family endonuclease